jgi:hypothetical protein
MPAAVRVPNLNGGEAGHHVHGAAVSRAGGGGGPALAAVVRRGGGTRVGLLRHPAGGAGRRVTRCGIQKDDMTLGRDVADETRLHQSEDCGVW